MAIEYAPSVGLPEFVEHTELELPESKYALTNEQLDLLPDVARVAYEIETDMVLREFQERSSNIIPRQMELTGWDEPTVKKANIALTHKDARTAPLAQLANERGKYRLELTPAGKTYLKSEVLNVGGLVLVDEH